MFDAPSFPRSRPVDAVRPSAVMDALRRPIAVAAGDRTRFLGHGETRHLNRTVPCGWHLAVHRGAGDGFWTHLYKVVPDHGGRVLVLLHHALEGDLGDTPEPFSVQPLPVGGQGCELRPKSREGRCLP